MPVYLHLANLIVSKSAVEKRYEGGLRKFREDYSINSDEYRQEDGMLFSIAGMNMDEFDLGSLSRGGLHFDAGSGTSEDFTIYSRYGGCAWKVDWLEENEVFAWHVDDNDGLIKRAIEVGAMTMAEISELQEKGENPLGTIN